MSTYGIRDVISFEVKDGNGNIISTLSNAGLSSLSLYYSSKLTKQDKLNPENIEKVIFNPPATVVIFKDGTKEVVKAHNEEFDYEKGFAMAMLNVMFGNNKSELKRFIKKHIDESNKKK